MEKANTTALDVAPKCRICDRPMFTGISAALGLAPMPDICVDCKELGMHRGYESIGSDRWEPCGRMRGCSHTYDHVRAT